MGFAHMPETNYYVTYFPKLDQIFVVSDWLGVRRIEGKDFRFWKMDSTDAMDFIEKHGTGAVVLDHWRE